MKSFFVLWFFELILEFKSELLHLLLHFLGLFTYMSTLFIFINNYSKHISTDSKGVWNLRKYKKCFLSCGRELVYVGMDCPSKAKESNVQNSLQ